MELREIQQELRKSATVSPAKAAVFFKTGKGHYGEGDQFIGVTVPTVRKIAREGSELTFEELAQLLGSKVNEERLLALIILVGQYKKASLGRREEIFQFYLAHRSGVNNWNLVDSSAHLIVGAHLWDKDRQVLVTLAQSEILWDRRIAIVATWFFIRNQDLGWTFKLSAILITDPQDLIHKAVGWMLREAGKRNQAALVDFLNEYAGAMPRTMLRYAIEKFSPKERKIFLTTTLR